MSNALRILVSVLLIVAISSVVPSLACAVMPPSLLTSQGKAKHVNDDATQGRAALAMPHTDAGADIASQHRTPRAAFVCMPTPANLWASHVPMLASHLPADMPPLVGTVVLTV